MKAFSFGGKKPTVKKVLPVAAFSEDADDKKEKEKVANLLHCRHVFTASPNSKLAELQTYFTTLPTKRCCITSCMHDLHSCMPMARTRFLTCLCKSGFSQPKQAPSEPAGIVVSF